jgi:superfamily II DNA or RNA helicase
VGRLAERTMNAQEKPVGQLLLHDLERAEVAWPPSIEDLRPGLPERKSPRPDQQEAIDKVLGGFADADRGQLIMACGTGKTLVSLWITESLGATRTLVLVPSLSLLKQTIREWLLNAAHDFEFLPVCSDDTVREHDQMVAYVADLGFPATGNPEEVSIFLSRTGPRVVFSTYQSSPAVAAAMKANGPAFDLAIADEAHRCAGPASSDFATILDSGKIRATKRLFMTATPRYFTGRIRKEGIDTDFEIASMDDEERFGVVLHRLSFGEAIDRDLLSDYRVLVIGVNNDTYREYAEQGRFVTRDRKEVTDARSLAAQMGLAKAIRKYDLRRTITFHGRVKAARDFAESLPDVIAWMPADERPDGHICSDYVSGMMNSSEREMRLQRLRAVGDEERGVLANARCLSEGVDVPTLDGVAFIHPKRSEVDIAQAVGRAIRKAEKKELGTIVIPVFVGESEDPREAVERSAFKPIWEVIRALRDHDEELANRLDELRREATQPSSLEDHIPRKIVIDMPERVGDDFVRAFETKLVEQTTATWEFWFGLLQSYVDRTGDARVRFDHVEGDFRLGGWVNAQRSAYSTGNLDPARVARLESLKGWSWSVKRGHGWERGFHHLQQFFGRNGHGHVPANHMEGDFPLGSWVQEQLLAHSEGTLQLERVSRLGSLRGWTWSAWEEGFDHLQRFVDDTGHPHVPANHMEGDFPLGSWVQQQFQAYRQRSLDHERVSRLRSVRSWNWSRSPGARGRPSRWEEGFNHLQRFIDRTGHASVPANHMEEDYPLGNWLQEQLEAHSNRKLDRERTRRLGSLLGWQLEATTERQKLSWEDAFLYLQQFVNREGHALVPQEHLEGKFRLGNWVTRQRFRNSTGTLNPKRVERLEALPRWSWNLLADQWEEGFAQLVRFADREKHARVHADHVERDYRLGRWVVTQRVAYRKGKLEPERARRLESLPGWEWNPGKRRVEAER